MPVVTIDILEGKGRKYKKAIQNGVHNALIEALKIPEGDRTQKLFEHSPEDFLFPGNYSDAFTMLTIRMFEGRSMDAKRALYQAIVANLTDNPGIDGKDIFIMLDEHPKDNWGIRGGFPASELDLGYKVDV